MKLTPDQIEAFRVDAYSDVADEVCRLAVIGLEYERLRAERDSRPEITAEDCALIRDAIITLPTYDVDSEPIRAVVRVTAALRAHARKVKP